MCVGCMVEGERGEEETGVFVWSVVEGERCVCGVYGGGRDEEEK